MRGARADLVSDSHVVGVVFPKKFSALTSWLRCSTCAAGAVLFS